MTTITACYWCDGTGLMLSDEECPCTTGSCDCQFCKRL